MGLLQENDKKEIKKKFDSELEKKVKIVFFSSELDCQYCSQIKTLMEEVKELSEGKIEFNEFNFHNDKKEVQKYNVEKQPVLVFLDENDNDTGIRFFGIPAGYEFTTFLEIVVMISAGKDGLSEKVKEKIEKVDKPLDIKVFITTQCPHCPRAAVMAARLSYINENIKGSVVEAMEFQEWAQKYSVYGVPKTIVNDKIEFEGAVPEKVFVKEVLKALE